MLFTLAGIMGLIGLYIINVERAFVWLEVNLHFPEWWFKVVDATIAAGYACLIGGMLWQLI